MLTGVTSFARKCRWYLRALGRNPLVRLSDRLEAFAVLGVLVLALIAVPVSVHLGSKTYESRMHTAAEQTQTRHSVEAVVVEGSMGMPADFDSPAYVQVEWREGAVTHNAQVISPETVKAGAPLTIWLDDSGKVVGAPLTPVDAKVSALGVAWTIWISAVVLSVFAALVVRQGLDRSRARAWERELLLLAHNDDGWANRHT